MHLSYSRMPPVSLTRQIIWSSSALKNLDQAVELFKDNAYPPGHAARHLGRIQFHIRMLASYYLSACATAKEFGVQSEEPMPMKQLRQISRCYRNLLVLSARIEHEVEVTIDTQPRVIHTDSTNWLGQTVISVSGGSLGNRFHEFQTIVRLLSRKVDSIRVQRGHKLRVIISGSTVSI